MMRAMDHAALAGVIFYGSFVGLFFLLSLVK